jgi:hypothetical protein
MAFAFAGVAAVFASIVLISSLRKDCFAGDQPVTSRPTAR